MPDQTDWTKSLLFPRVLRAISISASPGRLILGLLAVTALITAGRAWDALDTPTFSPRGLTAGPMAAAEQEQVQDLLQGLVTQYGGPEQQPAEGADWPPLDARDVVVIVRDRFEAAASAAEAAPAGMTSARLREILAEVDAVRPRGTFEATASHISACFLEFVRGVIDARLTRVLSAARGLLIDMPAILWHDHLWFTIVFGVLLLVVAAVVGGAISRITVYDLADRPRLSIRQSIDFSLSHGRHLVAAPVTPLVFAAVLGAVIVLIAFVFMNIPGLDVIGGLLYGVNVLLGMAVAFLLIVYFVGFFLLIPAVAADSCDAFDAQQRAYAYVLGRPFHLLGYGIVGLVGLALGYLIAALFAAVVLNVTAGLVGLGTVAAHPALDTAGGFQVFDLVPFGAEAMHASWRVETTAGLIGFWQTVVVNLVIAYVFSYFFTAATVIYLLLRRVCDGRAIDDLTDSDPYGGYMSAPVGESPENAPTDDR